MGDFSDWLQNNWIDLARLGVQTAILVAIVRYGRRLLAALRASQEQIGALLKLSVADGMNTHDSTARNEFPGAAEREPEVEIAGEPFAEPRAASFEREATRPRVAITEPAFEPHLAREARPPMWEPEPQPEPAFAGPASLRHSSWHASEAGGQSLGGQIAGGSGFGASTAVLDPPIAHNEPSISRNEPLSHQEPIPRSEVRPFTPWVSAPSTGPETRASIATTVAAKRGGVQSWLNAPMRSSGPGPVKKIFRWLQSPAGGHSRPAR